MKYAVCNELFDKLTFENACQKIAQHGFEGVEIAPFTLFDDPKTVSQEHIREIARILQATGLQFAGFHWLFLRPEGLHLTSADSGIRARSWEHLRRLIDIAGELGGGDLVLGSPKQRNVEGISIEQGKTYLQEGLASLATYTEERHSTILIEALPAKYTNIINTLEEVKTLVNAVDKVGVSGMFDFHNNASEPLSWEELLAAYYDVIQHIHLNEINGSYPGTGTSDFLPAFQTLIQKGYSGWMSLEIFHMPENPEIVLSHTRQFLNTMEAQCTAKLRFRGREKEFRATYPKE
ncbi:xylose isomerase domain protein TIM barrel [Candidatus Vecturithrix granuli]|uniref:Xylose isomerase domain protein TIM barrel n=1 Tax=Vecturithrix granuli TaxID=1499967 RepID=A0A081BW12_VECG1|nr:xylose isomerase domain protein TIM barrel [Candidatus Vecturithrix granuli]